MNNDLGPTLTALLLLGGGFGAGVLFSITSSTSRVVCEWLGR